MAGHGAARVSAACDWLLTFTAGEEVEAMPDFAEATIVPMHYEGWAYFSESRMEIAQTFEQAGLDHRLRRLPARQFDRPGDRSSRVCFSPFLKHPSYLDSEAASIQQSALMPNEIRDTLHERRSKQRASETVALPITL